MSQDGDKKLSEIGHLFLSSIRSKAGNGSPAPRRTPPGERRTEGEVVLSPEEMKRVCESVIGESGRDEGDEAAPVTAVIAAHLAGKQNQRVGEYARHLAGMGDRVGLMEVDACEFRLTRFDSESSDRGDAEVEAELAATESFDAQRMSEALAELGADVDRWLLLLPTVRSPEARKLLREVKHWVLLCTCDHDGVVAGYRALKGLSDLWGADDERPALSLALLDAADEEHAQRISEKLGNVCGQFLKWTLDAQGAVSDAPGVGEHVVLSCRPLHDKTQVAAAPQWEIASNFLARSARAKSDAVRVAERVIAAEIEEPSRESDQKKWAARLTRSEAPPRAVAGVIGPQKTEISALAAPMRSQDVDVIDLAADAGEGAILSAVLHTRADELVACPITPPMCPGARLAVGRDHRIVLYAVATQGLAELPSIGSALRWLSENRALIRMAVPQLAIDVDQPPQLHLLIDQSDWSAATLRPILQSGQVTVQTYRTVKWSGRRGLLLEAA